MRQFLATPSPSVRTLPFQFWFGLALAFAIVCSWLGLQEAFETEYVIQDDARQHVFWMLRFLDPQLFPNDWIADYFQFVAPAGYSSLYRLAAELGISPLVFNKFLPTLLGLVTTVYTFLTCMELLPVPFAAFSSASILNLTLWMKDDLISGTPRAFVYPLLAIFLYYLLRKKLVPCTIAVILTGLFYPQYVLVEAGVLVLQGVQFPRLEIDRETLYFCGIGAIVAFLVLLPYAFGSSLFSPVVTVAEAKSMPEFFSGGRSSFFQLGNPIEFWFLSERSGFLPLETPITLWVGLALPFLRRFQKQLPLMREMTAKNTVIVNTLLTAIVLFFAAHALLFRLHLPSRYTHHSFRIMLALLSGMTIAILVNALLQWAKTSKIWIKAIAFVGVTILVASVAFYPAALGSFPNTSYKKGSAPQVYQFFQQQPKDTLIATLAREASFIPAFARRSVLISEEQAIPYHLGYYQEIRQRFVDLLTAQYAEDPLVVRQFIDNYGIDFWLLDREAFTPTYPIANRWVNDFYTSPIGDDRLVKTTIKVVDRLSSGEVPALSKTVPACSVLETPEHIVLDSGCIKNNLGPSLKEN